MARPRKEINWEIVERKMEAGCTAREISAGICDINTFYDRFKEHFGKSFADFSDNYYEIGNGNIKFTQYMKALAGNIQLLLMLGRERLGQGKEPEKQSPYEDVLSLRHENLFLKAALDELKEKLQNLNNNKDSNVQDEPQASSELQSSE